jgi:hypothetical protein
VSRGKSAFPETDGFYKAVAQQKIPAKGPAV